MAEWFAYGGVVTLKGGERPVSRQDKNRTFERLVLASAPKKLIPEHFANLHQ